jgi:GMP synthase (glutamine-hydrolysing)
MRVLSVTHGPSVPGGVFADAVEAAGHVLERWSAPLEGTAGQAGSYDAVMVFGGSMHPDQDDQFHWLGREEGFLRDVLAEGVPALGVCLGAQMLARSAGARVAPAASREIGWLDVELTPEGREDPVLRALPARTTEAWVAEEEDELPVPADQFLEETASRIAAWNEQGRSLCSAFLQVAGGRSAQEDGAMRSTASLAAEA